MGQVSNSDVVQLFKKVYGGMTDLQPGDFPLQKTIPFSEKQKVGDSYNEAVVLTAENGITFGGTGADAYDINPAIAGSVKQATVSPYTSILGSVVPWGMLSRSAGGGEVAFYDGTKHIVRNHLKSHGKFLEIMRWYGQAASGLGYVSYASATYRGVSLTNGGGTVGGVSFTAGVNTTSKAIMLAPGQFAAGIWVGSEGVVVNQVATATGLVVATGKLTSVDAANGILYVDFTPVAATSATSHKLVFQGMEGSKEMVGINKILGTTSGNLFGIPVSGYSLWKGIQDTNGSLKLKLDDLARVVAQMVNVGGLGQDGNGDLEVHLNPRSWKTMMTTEAGRRMYDQSYKSGEMDNGAEKVSFYSEAGKLSLVSNRFVKEGEVYGLHLDDWSRSGSTEITFKVPGIERDLIFPLENQAAMAFRSFADQYMFCHAPARSFVLTGVNDESST
jgi:hypothetical protein